MATPLTPDEQSASVSGDEGDSAIEEGMPFNPLTGDLNDLRITCGQCWLWPQITAEFDRLDAVVDNARTFLEPLTSTGCPDWAQQAAIGIVRSNLAIHQHAEHHGSYIAAARSLWTTRIPHDSPTLSDAQIFALLAIHEARLTAETYSEIAAGIEDEMQLAGIGHDDEQEIGWLRSENSGWERGLWRDAADRTGTAEKFLLMANFAASAPDPVALKKAESQIATLRSKARKAEAVVAPFRNGRPRGATARITRALNAIVQEIGSRDIKKVLDHIEYLYSGEQMIEGVLFEDANDVFVFYRHEGESQYQKIRIDSLRRKLADIPDE